MQKPLPVRWLIIQGLTENEHCGIQAYACNTESQEDLYAEVPLVGRLTGIEEVKVEAIAMRVDYSKRDAISNINAIIAE